MLPPDVSQRAEIAQSRQDVSAKDLYFKRENEGTLEDGTQSGAESRGGVEERVTGRRMDTEVACQVLERSAPPAARDGSDLYPGISNSWEIVPLS